MMSKDDTTRKEAEEILKRQDGPTMVFCEDGLVHMIGSTAFDVAVCGQTVDTLRQPRDNDDLCNHCGPAALKFAKGEDLPS